MQHIYADSDSGDFPGEWLDGTEWACAMEVTKETFVKTQQAALVVVFCRWKWCGFSVDLNKWTYVYYTLIVHTVFVEVEWYASKRFT